GLPSMVKLTKPVGVPDPDVGATVAVNVTDCPNCDGLAEELIEVVVPAWFTVWVMAADVLALKFASPEYVTVMVWLPSDRLEVERLAVPPVSVPVPSVVAPSVKVTVPPGVPAAGATALIVAVNVVDCPNTVGFVELVTVAVLAPLFTV